MSTNDYQAALNFTGSVPLSGKIQLELLRREGCVPESRVLDVGCGALHAGYELMQYLDAEHYVGLEPNGWLIDVGLSERPGGREIAEVKGAAFISGVWEFDSCYISRFDFALGHS